MKAIGNASITKTSAPIIHAGEVITISIRHKSVLSFTNFPFYHGRRGLLADNQIVTQIQFHTHY